ncbi:hypothetical protein FIBSPDRAFT_300920 [Athelia psychrophila]|uniref:Uncharacterized protein n=1 Tax=Athelia psychrophila TaxID=1759441 RepID=A0A167X6V2_9AGAM|nr:hypothetical protein FIBSPDRAFT_300920 [Fibularhizoctonia sp. CBS 109695]
MQLSTGKRVAVGCTGMFFAFGFSFYYARRHIVDRRREREPIMHHVKRHCEYSLFLLLICCGPRRSLHCQWGRLLYFIFTGCFVVPHLPGLIALCCTLYADSPLF